ncbi:hypothetical protein EXN66_Car017956 [Channa argus]|uniref:Uncharacterized protein n=1 Tax=Channa argus TaxID=215402 RepID=A0A6G1QJ40_CHAAH|nr:hypothetical protein EXN66_Car017956 [Channa argus]
MLGHNSAHANFQTRYVPRTPQPIPASPTAVYSTSIVDTMTYFISTSYYHSN